MTESGDSWASGTAYESFMGRWSRALAREFVAWLPPERGAHWLDVGCGTGALTATICEHCDPASVTGCDPAAPFIEHARRILPDPRATFVVADSGALPARPGGFDRIVSGLVLNFLPDPAQAVAAMRDRVRSGGVVAAYVWDYVEGAEFLRLFWEEAVAADPRAADSDEGRRFPLAHGPALESVFQQAGLRAVEIGRPGIVTEFADFDDYWTSFLGRTGPAPTYVAALDPSARDRLEARLRRRLQGDGGGPIRLGARAWAVRGVVA